MLTLFRRPVKAGLNDEQAGHLDLFPLTQLVAVIERKLACGIDAVRRDHHDVERIESDGVIDSGSNARRGETGVNHVRIETRPDPLRLRAIQAIDAKLDRIARTRLADGFSILKERFDPFKGLTSTTLMKDPS